MDLIIIILDAPHNHQTVFNGQAAYQYPAEHLI